MRRDILARAKEIADEEKAAMMDNLRECVQRQYQVMYPELNPIADDVWETLVESAFVQHEINSAISNITTIMAGAMLWHDRHN